MIHFTCKPFDAALDWPQICSHLFGMNKCLVMVERKGGEHGHIQGEEILPQTECDKYIRSLNGLHYLKKLDPNRRPVKRRKLEATEEGFQYMSKELPTSAVVYKQGFTDADLEELYAKSNEYREELQCKLGEYLVSKVVRASGEGARQLHKRLCGAALQYYMDQDKMCPPNIKLLVRHFMLKYWGKDSDVFEYLSELIM